MRAKTLFGVPIRFVDELDFRPRTMVDLRAIDKDERIGVFLRDAHGVRAIIGDTRKDYPLPGK